MNCISFLYNPLNTFRGLFLIFAIGIVVSGCKDNNIGFESIDSSDLVENEFIYFEDFGNPYAITIACNSELIFVSQHNVDFLVSVYDFEGNLKGKFIKNGIGPEEQLNNLNLKIDEVENKIYSFDVEKNYLYIYSLDSIISNKFENPLLEYNKLANIQLNQPVLLNKNQFIDFYTFGSDLNTQMAIFDTLGNVSPFGEIPNYDHSVSSSIYTDAFYGNVQYINDKVYINYFWTDYIQEFDVSGKLLNFSFGPHQFIPYYNEFRSGDFMQPRPDLDKSRFAFLSRISEINGGLGLLFNGKFIQGGESSNVIYIFDYNLTPKKKYNISESLLFFDGCNNIVFAYSPNYENGLLKYELQ